MKTFLLISVAACLIAFLGSCASPSISREEYVRNVKAMGMGMDMGKQQAAVDCRGAEARPDQGHCVEPQRRAKTEGQDSS